MSNLAASPKAYRRDAILTASRGQLVVLLYDGARRFLRQAAAAMREGEIERCHNTLRRAELIIGHLDGTLDRDQGLLADRLHAIYMFSMRQLSEARFDRDAGRLDDVGAILGELRDAWAQIADEEPAS
jgi:flagellar protein FliS